MSLSRKTRDVEENLWSLQSMSATSRVPQPIQINLSERERWNRLAWDCCSPCFSRSKCKLELRGGTLNLLVRSRSYRLLPSFQICHRALEVHNAEKTSSSLEDISVHIFKIQIQLTQVDLEGFENLIFGCVWVFNRFRAEPEPTPPGKISGSGIQGSSV